MLSPKLYWIPDNCGSKSIWITKIGSNKLLDTEAFLVPINVRSKNILSPKFVKAQKMLGSKQILHLKKYWVKKIDCLKKIEFSKKS